MKRAALFGAVMGLVTGGGVLSVLALQVSVVDWFDDSAGVAVAPDAVTLPPPTPEVQAQPTAPAAEPIAALDRFARPETGQAPPGLPASERRAVAYGAPTPLPSVAAVPLVSVTLDGPPEPFLRLTALSPPLAERATPRRVSPQTVDGAAVQGGPEPDVQAPWRPTREAAALAPGGVRFSPVQSEGEAVPLVLPDPVAGVAPKSPAASTANPRPLGDTHAAALVLPGPEPAAAPRPVVLPERPGRPAPPAAVPTAEALPRRGTERPPMILWLVTGASATLPDWAVVVDQTPTRDGGALALPQLDRPEDVARMAAALGAVGAEPAALLVAADATLEPERLDPVLALPPLREAPVLYAAQGNTALATHLRAKDRRAMPIYRRLDATGGPEATGAALTAIAARARRDGIVVVELPGDPGLLDVVGRWQEGAGAGLDAATLADAFGG